jgi:hypothetical protein
MPIGTSKAWQRGHGQNPRIMLGFDWVESGREIPIDSNSAVEQSEGAIYYVHDDGAGWRRLGRSKQALRAVTRAARAQGQAREGEG